ncbi:type IV pilus modification PilV family protein [Geminocystis herdmanii]|uniref:type IV pilus modification PilV family protein n=1 Tax=Geminocystis herdmanii TaxID=669359 RepID=UPI00034A5411|nr:prepilin-type N-terminal cleavage/methylation domain-containing protein [Geminocystis herdmanii]
MLLKFILIDRLLENRITSNHPQESFSLLVKHKEQGFSLLEVLVTILVISGFLLGSLQATVLATLLRIQAQDKQDAINWTQQDVELMRYKAFTLVSDQDNCGNYGEKLEEKLISSGFFPEQDDVLINGKEYRVERLYLQSDNILQINHIIKYDHNHPRYKGTTADNTVTKLSTEELPHVALSC